MMKRIFNKIMILLMFMASAACPVFAQHQWVYTDTDLDKIYYVEDSSIREGHSGYEVEIVSTGRHGGHYSNREHRVFYYRYNEERWYTFPKGHSKYDRAVDQMDEPIKRVHEFCINYLRNR